MNDDSTPDLPPGDSDAPRPDAGPQSQEIRYSQLSALVPERVSRGVFSTGAVVLQGNHEFIIDFLLRMAKPHQVVARVILPPGVVPQLVGAGRENYQKWRERYAPQAPPAISEKPAGAAKSGNQEKPPSPQDLYDELKLPDDVMCGSYANAVMIAHSATEFVFDFITAIFPRSVVSSRVYLAAPNVPRFLDSLAHSFAQFQRKIANPPPPPPPEFPDDEP